MLKLGVNIDHVATLRQARYRGCLAENSEPDPVEAAVVCQNAGAHGITAHLREDRRHIQDEDIQRIKNTITVPLNLEMAVTEAMLDYACQLLPHEVCLVPENRAEVTTEGGLDVASQKSKIKDAIARLSSKGIRISLFIDPDPIQVEAAVAVGARCIELHTGACAMAIKPQEQELQLSRLSHAAIQAHRCSLQVNAGHGLHYRNLLAFMEAVPHLDTLNIGHAIVSRAVFDGLSKAVKEMLDLMKHYPKNG